MYASGILESPGNNPSFILIALRGTSCFCINDIVVFVPWHGVGHWLVLFINSN